MDYAIIKVGNKQHRVRDGETLVVDRVHTEAGKSFEPQVLLGDDGAAVTVTVVAHERGPKIRIGKYRKRTGYKRHTGFRAATSRIEVSIGAGKKSAAKKAEPKAAAPPEEITTEEPTAAAQVAASPEPVAAEQEPLAEKPAEPAVAEEPAADEAEKPAPKGLPAGYEKLTVVAINEGAKTWRRPQLEAALAYEQEHAKRKGALAALDSALAAKDGDS